MKQRRGAGGRTPASSGWSNIKTKVQKYKGVFKSDVEERRRIVVTIISYSKDENY